MSVMPRQPWGRDQRHSPWRPLSKRRHLAKLRKGRGGWLWDRAAGSGPHPPHSAPPHRGALSKATRSLSPMSASVLLRLQVVSDWQLLPYS